MSITASERLGQDNAEDLREPEWAGAISGEEWKVCLSAFGALQQAGIDFIVGGAFGLAVYTQRFRDTKDIDLFILPDSLTPAVNALLRTGFADYYSRLPYDRGWIFRSTRDGFIVDLIFQMANRRASVDAVWFERAQEIRLRGERLKIISAEELLWQKLYVLQRDRCDWPDILNLAHATANKLDWEHLFAQLGPDLPLLRGLMQVFEWLSPQHCAQVPEKLRQELRILPTGPEEEEYRASLLDSRAWFAPLTPAAKPLEI